MAVGACAHGPRLSASPDGPRGLAGAWDLVERRFDAEGDERIDRHELQLEQHDGRLAGVWHRSVRWASWNGQPFLCNGRLAYEERLASRVSGTASDREGRFRAVLEKRSGGPCTLGEVRSLRCELARDGARLVVVCKGSGTFVFARRLGGGSATARHASPARAVTEREAGHGVTP